MHHLITANQHLKGLNFTEAKWPAVSPTYLQHKQANSRGALLLWHVLIRLMWTDCFETSREGEQQRLLSFFTSPVALKKKKKTPACRDQTNVQRSRAADPVELSQHHELRFSCSPTTGEDTRAATCHHTDPSTAGCGGEFERNLERRWDQHTATKACVAA